MASALCKLHARCPHWRSRGSHSLRLTATPTQPRLQTFPTWLQGHHHPYARCNSTMTPTPTPTSPQAAMTPTPTPTHVGLLVTDFDDTCTTKDTIGILMSAALHARHTAAPASTDLSLPTRLTETYLAKQQALMAQLLPPEPPTTPSPLPFDRPGLEALLSQLSDFDLAMNSIALEQGAVAGLTPAQITEAAAAVQLRPGCREMLQRCRASGLPFHVLSVNWSAAFVAAALDLGPDLRPITPPELQAPPTQPALSTQPGPALLVANQLEIGPDGRSSGRLHAAVQCARDKGRAFTWLLQRHRAPAPPGPGPGLSVYVGDSASDLLPLLDADVGIVLGTSSTLRTLARRFGVALLPLAAAPRPGQQQQQRPAGQLFTAASWEEVSNFVFSSSSSSTTSSGSESLPPPVQGQGQGQVLPPSQSTPPNGSYRASSPSPSTSGSSGPSPAPFVPRVLVVAGSDSGGGAGVQADLKAVLACGAFGTCALTALTAQNTHGVHGVHETPLAFLEAQMDAVLSDIGADAVKTGMLPSAAAVQAVAAKIRQYGVRSLVVDPVMVSTSGHSLAAGSVPDAILHSLGPLATLLTPNLPEASKLLGGMVIESVGDMEEAARKLRELAGCQAVLLKGGHLAAAAGAGADMVDVLFDGRRMVHVSMPRLETGNTHGTGCTLASAIAAGLAKGLPMEQAVRQGRAYLHAALSRSVPLRIGSGVQRPFNHGFMVAEWGAGGRVDAGAVRRALRLYAVTDAGCNARAGRGMEEAVRAAVEGGASIVQIREKDAEGGAFLAAAAAAYKVCRAAGVPLIINDRIDVALATGPDVGVHVGQGDLPAVEARKLLGPGRILGVSVRSVEQARAAIQDGADYLGCGAVFPTSTKDSGVIGLSGLAAVCAEAGAVPVVSIGGVALGNAASTIQAGAAGVAVVSAVFAAGDVVAATRELRAVVDAVCGE